MILMRIVARVAEDHVGRNASFQRLEPGLDVGSLAWEETILELRQLDDRPGGSARNASADARASSARGPQALNTAQCTSKRTPRPIQPRIVAPAPISMSLLPDACGRLGVPTAQNCLLKSMGLFGCDLSLHPLQFFQAWHCQLSIRTSRLISFGQMSGLRLWYQIGKLKTHSVTCAPARRRKSGPTETARRDSVGRSTPMASAMAS